MYLLILLAVSLAVSAIGWKYFIYFFSLGYGFGIADLQKNAAKKVDPKRFVDTGLYRIVRCPNYLGELVIWTGALLSAIGAGLCWWQWLVAIIGWLGIVYVMFSGARRLELRQEQTYGSDPAFREYSGKTPILLPLVPLYSLARHKWLQA